METEISEGQREEREFHDLVLAEGCFISAIISKHLEGKTFGILGWRAANYGAYLG